MDELYSYDKFVVVDANYNLLTGYICIERNRGNMWVTRHYKATERYVKMLLIAILGMSIDHV